MSKCVHLSLVLVLAMAVIITSSPAAAKQRDGVLEAELELATGAAKMNVNDELLIRFTLTNHGKESLSVLKWQTPLAGIEHPILVVELYGEPVPYIGKLVKRAAPTVDDYVEIEPGCSISVLFDPTDSYEMSLTGYYSLRYETKIEVRRTAALKSASSRNIRVQSDSVDLWIDGLEKLPEISRGTGFEKALSFSGGCTSSEQSTLTTAFNDTKTITGDALDDLNADNACHYDTWFGTYTSSRYNTVTSNYQAILDAFEDESVVIDCSCTDNYYAYVYKNQPYKIYVCNAFWSAPAIGWDSKAGTLLHEMSHFTVVADTDDHVYGRSGCQDLADSDPDKAIENADSHEYNAENTYLTPCGGGSGATELTNGVPVTGLSASTGNELDYFMEVPSGSTNLVFEIAGGSGDADLYVKYGSEPTTSSYDCRPYKSGNNETCTFASPSAGTWYVMVRAYSTFSSVSLEGSYDSGGGAPCTGCDHYTGSLSGTGDSDNHPNGTYYYASSGAHQGWLEGPASADFDLYLYRWNGSSWSRVATSESASSSESINYSGTSGYYYWKVYSYSGSGSYDLWLDTP